jgi:hypothetical protein
VPLVTYRPSMQMDMILSKLYTDIVYAGDAEGLLTPQARTLSGFLQNCQSPNVCLLGFDEGEMSSFNGPWLWANFEPCFSGAFAGLWIKPEKRGTKQAARFTFELLEAALSTCPLLLNVTKQRNLVAEHEKLGYRLVGVLPKLWEDQDVWLLALEPQGLTVAKERFAGLWAAPAAMAGGEPLPEYSNGGLAAAERLEGGEEP